MIGGLQKVSLIDYPGKVAAVIFTRGCSFRCHYCHNPELAVPQLFKEPLSERLVLDFLASRKRNLDGVVVTGGEPAMQRDLLEFLAQLKGIGYLVKLDTCGAFPEAIEEAIRRKLVDYIAMDIKAPLDRYRDVVGVNVDPKKIKRSIDAIKGGGIDHEFRTTIVKSQLSMEEVIEIAKYLSPSDRYVLQKFAPAKTLDPKFANESTYTDQEFEQIKIMISNYVGACSVR
jgi:pyruvate formate lyase activating enzyme